MGVIFLWFVYWLLFSLALSLIVGVAANTRGRNPFAWGVLSVIFSPILTGLLLLALPRDPSDGDSGVTILKWTAALGLIALLAVIAANFFS